MEKAIMLEFKFLHNKNIVPFSCEKCVVQNHNQDKNFNLFLLVKCLKELPRTDRLVSFTGCQLPHTVSNIT